MRDHRKEDRMESFFLSETTKYLYLLFDVDNFIHNQGQHGTVIDTPNGECIIETGGYIFNTEAHPVDPSALHCCHDIPKLKSFNFSDFSTKGNIFRGDTLSGRKKKLKDGEDKNDNSAVKETVPEKKEEIEEEVREVESRNSPSSSSIEEVEINETELENSNFSQLEFSILDYTVKVVSNEEKSFDPEKMLERFKTENRFPKNKTWENKYELLSCKAQPFLQKLSIFGEFFKR